MSISGSIPVVICLLLYVIQRENYNYILGRRLLITGIFFYLIPIQLIKYLIPEEVYPEALFNEEAQLYLSNSLSFWTERKGEYIWMPQWFDIVSKLWLGGIVIFAVYEIIKYWRGVHYIKNFIFEKEEDSENNLTYYLIPDEGVTKYDCYQTDGNYISSIPYGNAKTIIDNTMVSDGFNLPSGEREMIVWNSPYGLCAYSRTYKDYYPWYSVDENGNSIENYPDVSQMPYELNEDDIRQELEILGLPENIVIPTSNKTE